MLLSQPVALKSDTSSGQQSRRAWGEHTSTQVPGTAEGRSERSGRSSPARHPPVRGSAAVPPGEAPSPCTARLRSSCQPLPRPGLPRSRYPLASATAPRASSGQQSSSVPTAMGRRARSCSRPSCPAQHQVGSTTPGCKERPQRRRLEPSLPAHHPWCSPPPIRPHHLLPHSARRRQERAARDSGEGAPHIRALPRPEQRRPQGQPRRQLRSAGQAAPNGSSGLRPRPPTGRRLAAEGAMPAKGVMGWRAGR